MVLFELAGIGISSSKVLFRTISNAFQQSVALTAPNGTIFQKMGGALFGIESTTQMLPNEAKLVLGFEIHHEPSVPDIHRRLGGMFDLNDLKKGGSPYLNERFLAAAHVLTRRAKA
jgi:hypothetical protein